ncbi:MAG: hypothetical protein JJU02_06570 [Cryomorphaceae bacterium]|nr:hypothetical protein [Cryomorphaceae bacterium]
MIPKDYLEHRIFSGHGKEERFNYQDSIILYFSNDKGSGTLNFKNISDSGLSEKKFTFLANEKKSFSPLILNGKDEQGLFWKEYIE